MYRKINEIYNEDSDEESNEYDVGYVIIFDPKGGNFIKEFSVDSKNIKEIIYISETHIILVGYHIEFWNIVTETLESRMILYLTLKNIITLPNSNIVITFEDNNHIIRYQNI